MANHYLQFSEVLSHLTEEEERWLRHQLEIVWVIGDKEYVKADVPDNLNPADAEWEGCRAYRDLDGYEPDFGEYPGFAYNFSDDLQGSWGRHLWLYTEEWGCVDQAAHLIQKFLRAFRPDQCWSLTYATTCSKPRVGEFGGGAVFVTADDIKWHNAYEVVEQERATFDEPKVGNKSRVVLNMSGGLVQDIFSSDPDTEVILVDWDTEGCDPADDGFVEITDPHGRTQLACVARREIIPLTELADTDVQAAMKAAGVNHGPS